MHSFPPLIDSHIHTDDERFVEDRPALLEAARRVNIVAQIVPGVSLRFWPRVKAVCDQETDLFACYGLHPCFLEEHHNNHLDQLALWLGREQPVAVGECGLDYQQAGLDRTRQQHLFAGQLALAREFDLPIVIHARKAVEDVIRMIRSAGHYRGMVHSFNGSMQQATRLIDLGYKLSFGGAVTYDRARRLRDMVSRLPLDAMLLETDAPDQPDAAHKSQRNEPANLLTICQHISTLRTESAENIAMATSRNATELYQLPTALAGTQ